MVGHRDCIEAVEEVVVTVSCTDGSDVMGPELAERWEAAVVLVGAVQHRG
jgi:hypothetical protein